MQNYKTCPGCHVRKEAGQYSKCRGRKDGLQSYCRACQTVRRMAYRARDPEAARAGDRRGRLRTYGLTVEEHAAQLSAQRGVCAICHNECTSGHSLAVDHSHFCCPGKSSCGKCVRGLLCRSCNLLVAHLENNDPEKIDEAMRYIENGGIWKPMNASTAAPT